MANSTISIAFKLDGQDKTFEILGKEASKFKGILDSTVTSADQLHKSVINWAAASASFKALGDLANQLSYAFKGLTDAYAVQQQAETQLETAMRNTMDAMDEDIQSIKNLTAAQQQMGVIGDEVQLAGAERLATFLKEKESLEKLIPVMNDVAAARYGLNVNGSNMASIAEAIGKAMDGQTTALRRMGISLDENTANLIKNGTESERVTAIAAVLSAKFEGMNEALAKTTSGSMKQFTNRLGDIKESLGGAATSVMKVITVLSQLATSFFGIERGASSIRSLAKIFNSATIKSKALSIQENITAASHRMQAAAAKMLGVSELTAATATGVLKTQIIALEAAMTLGLSAAITGAITLLSKLFSKSKDVTGAMNEASDVFEGITNPTEAYSSALSDTSKEISGYRIKLEALIKQKKEDSSLIDELNSKYGESFGVYKTQAEWYDVLKTKADEYIRLKALEAKAVALADRQMELGKVANELDAQAWSMRNDGSAWAKKGPFGILGVQLSDDFKELQGNISKVKEDAAKSANEYQEVIDEMSSLASGFTATPSSTKTTTSGGYSSVVPDLSKDIQEYRDSIKQALDINDKLMQGENAMDLQIKTMESGITSLIRKYGSENESVKALIEEYRKLKSARDLSKDALPDLHSFDQKSAGLVGAPMDTHKDLDKITDSAGGAQTAVSALTDTFRSLSSVVGESAAAWLDWASNLLSAISQAIPQIVALTAAQKGKANADAEGAVAAGMNSVANIPYVGPALAIAAAASIVAALAAIPKFAKGGIAFGPTLGMFGEYAGASSNPEVVAPLDKLRTMIQPASYDFGDVRFKIEGRDLVGVLGKRSNLSSRT
ncbi:MAG: hypothetical protein IJL91_05690 [Bacteroidales bacterium]|nr:hypothetical protein [Bacteroidales bacterium]